MDKPIGVEINGSASKWKPVTNGVPCVSVLGLMLFNTFVSDMDSGTEHTLSRFADDTKLQGAVNTLQGRDVIQRDLDRWVCASLMVFKAKCKVLPWVRAIPRTNTDWVENGLRAALRYRWTRSMSQ